MATHPPVTPVPRWARRARSWLRIGRAESPTARSDEQWAPPYDAEETLQPARTPEPWPPPPPLPPVPRMPEESVGDDEGVGSSRPRHRRVVAIGAAGAVLAAWVAAAVFVTPGRAKTGGLTQTAASQAPNNSGNGFGGFARRGTSGVIQSVVGPTITLLDRNGQSVSVRATTSTAFTKTVQVSVHQVQPGDTILAAGLYSAANATLTAGRITILGTGTIAGGGRSFPSAQGNTALGTVSSIAGDQLSVDQFDGTILTVIMSPSVTVSAPMAGSLRDLVQGESITVRGPSDANGDVEASQIQEGTNGGFFGPGFGRSPINNGGSFHLTPAGVMQS